MKADIGNANYVVCCTRIDEVNLIAAQQAHELGAGKIIARLRNQQYTSKGSIIRPEKFGVDIVIHPEKAAATEIARLVHHPYAVQAMEFEAGRLKMLGINITKNSLNIMDKTISQICVENEHFRFAVIAVLRGQKTIIPKASFCFEEGDIAYFVIKSSQLKDLLNLLEKKITSVKKVMVVGGSKMGRALSKELHAEDIQVRLVDYDRPKAGHISHQIEDVMVIYGDGTDIEFLKSENIQEVDSFIAVTENEKTNLISGLLAKHLGAKQSIIHVVTTEFIPTIQEIGAGAVISKNLSTVNAILQQLHSDESEVPIATFDEIDVDVMEFQPEYGSPITKKPIRDLPIPEDSIIGMINHHGKIKIASGESILSDDDIALVFAKAHTIPKLKKLFMA